jgi:transcriptional regulator with XRE-family HTH domain
MPKKRNHINPLINYGEYDNNRIIAGFQLDSLTKTLPDILLLWAKNDPDFFSNFYLNQLISPSQLINVLSAKFAIDGRLARMISFCVPGYRLLQDIEVIDHLTPIKFINSASRWYEQNSTIPLLDISDDVFHSFRLNILKNLAAPDNSILPQDNEITKATDTFSNVHTYLLNSLLIIGHQRDSLLTEQEVTVMLRKHYKENAEDTVHALSNLIPSIDDDIIRIFLKSLNLRKNKSSAVLALNFLRESNGYSTKLLGKLIGVNKGKIQHWESNTYPINKSILGVLCKILNCSDAEAKQFILLVRPDIIKHGKEEWLDRQISQKKWDYISFPALDPEWLAAQPKKEQAGILLHDLRERKKFTQENLDISMGKGQTYISLLEKGRKPINVLTLEIIINELELV